MDRIKKSKAIIRTLAIAFTVLLAFILLNFVIHVNRTNRYNAQIRHIDNESETTDVLVDIHPRGQTTDSWEKSDAFEGMVIYAKIMEASITNCSRSTLKNWSLRVDIQQECWINNAWNGTIEIHQFIDGNERVQTLSIQNYNVNELNLKYYIFGQDLLIPLSQGDYFIYYPCTDPSISEEKIDSNEYYNGTITPGFIFYSKDGNVNLSHYELSYQLEREVWSGREPLIFMVMLPIWAVGVLMFIVVSILASRYEKRIVRQTDATTAFLGVFVDFVDSKKSNKEGHSEKVATYARAIAKELGMKKADCENVYYAALMHDIGKCQVPEYLLQKRDGLTAEEIEQLRQHTIKGAEMLKKCAHIPFVVDSALYHHEKYDGTGYPYQKSGEEIPLIGRIVALADSCVSLQTGEDEHPGHDIEELIAELEKGRNTTFDPVLLDVLIDLLRTETI